MKNLIDYKTDSYHKNRHPEFLKSDTLTEAWSEFAYLEYFDGIKNKMVLEFGGAMGFNLFKLAETATVFMIEPSEIGCNYAAGRGIKCAKDLNEINEMNSQPFDLIFCRHVLEHLSNPLDTLLNLHSLLNLEGELLLILPVEKNSKPIENDIDFHLYCWTPRTAINLLKTAGFKVENWNYNYFTGKRVFLPIYKIFGVRTYRSFMKVLGRILGARELIIKAKK